MSGDAPRSCKKRTEKTTQQFEAASGATSPFLCVDDGKQMQHYTNITRMEQLARLHPFVGGVKHINATSTEDFDEACRTTRQFQSPWDLQILLAASGASIGTGCKVMNTHKSLLTLWWTPALAASERQTAKLQVVFFDITEAMHIMLCFFCLYRVYFTLDLLIFKREHSDTKITESQESA